MSLPPHRAESGIINCLRQAAGAYVTTAELINHLYGGDPEGGPEWASHCIRHAVLRLRRKGWPIESKGWNGYRYAFTVWEVPCEAIVSSGLSWRGDDCDRGACTIAAPAGAGIPISS